MKTPNFSISVTYFFLTTLSYFWSVHSNNHNDFIQCISQNNSSLSNMIYTQNNSSYQPILQSRIDNLRFNLSSTPKPLFIITPNHESQIPPIVSCSKSSRLQIRTRSGGHDYEGLSYTSHVPFLVLDLVNLDEITIDVKQKTAWVQVGTTIGQLYYEISEKSQTLGFPSGMCNTVGVGGIFSGGGEGTLLRKYGLSADNIIDARLVDVNGGILDRETMGEDLFWAIRGGGGASFGVITAWKVKLVNVPQTVTILSAARTLEQNATELVYRWQNVAPNLPKEIYMGIQLSRVASNRTAENSTIQATFRGLFLGWVDGLLDLMDQKFPELVLEREECTEVSWIQSALFFAGLPLDSSPRALASRTYLFQYYYKVKSDYVQEPIPEYGLKGMWRFLLEDEDESRLVILTPYGGRMEEISESSIPFPHRAGNLYQIFYLAFWNVTGVEESEKNLSWIRRFYNYMTPFVSMFPRAAYINYRDLDLGVNNEGNTSYAQANVWGFKYFIKNFNRLVRVKTMVDPSNFFRNEQSIPPFVTI